MKKLKFFVIVLVLTMGGTMTFAANETAKSSVEMAVPVTENKLMQEEINRMNERLEEIRDMDKAEMNAKDKKEIKKELKDMKKAGGTIYIGGATLILIIILIILLV